MSYWRLETSNDVARLMEQKRVTKRQKTRKRRRQAQAKPMSLKRSSPVRGKWLMAAIICIGLVGLGLLARRYLRESEQPIKRGVFEAQKGVVQPAREIAPPASDPAPDTSNAVETEAVPALSLEEKVLALKDEELKLARQLIAAFPHSEEPLVLMGDVQYRRGQTAESTRYWEDALARNPRRADIYERMATLAFDTDAFERAATLCQQSLALDPNRPGVNSLMARSLTRLGQYEEAIAAAQAEISISPHSPLSHFLLGRAHWQRRDYDQAERAYLQVIELQPDYTRAYYGLFNVYTRLKQPDKAKRYLDEFKKLDQQDSERAEKRRDPVLGDLNFFSLSLAQLCDSAHELYGKTGNGERTEGLLERAVALQPENVNYLEKLAFLYGVTERLPQALSVCQQIVEIDPNNATAYLNIGKFSMWQERFVPAESALKRAIACNPGHYGGYQELARLYLRTRKKLDRAQVLAQRAVTLRPIADNYFILGWACDMNGKPQDAKAALTRAMQLDPTQAKYRQAYERIEQREMSK